MDGKTVRVQGRVVNFRGLQLNDHMEVAYEFSHVKNFELVERLEYLQHNGIICCIFPFFGIFFLVGLLLSAESIPLIGCLVGVGWAGGMILLALPFGLCSYAGGKQIRQHFVNVSVVRIPNAASMLGAAKKNVVDEENQESNEPRAEVPLSSKYNKSDEAAPEPFGNTLYSPSDEIMKI